VAGRASPLNPSSIARRSRPLAADSLQPCSNAIKFTSKGEVCLRAEKLAESAGDATIQFRGSGYRNRDRARDEGKVVSRPLSPRQNARPAESLAALACLVIAAQLVEQMAGVLECESELGKGSVFILLCSLKDWHASLSQAWAVAQTALFLGRHYRWCEKRLKRGRKPATKYSGSW